MNPHPLINTVAAISELVDSLIGLPTNPPSIYLDLEGVNLSRHGSLSILQLLIYPSNKIHLLDIHNLGQSAFTTPGETKETLQGILQSESIPKVFFDVRNDSDALFSHFGIKLAGVEDLQLMELSTRPAYRKRTVSGLSRCIDRDLTLSGVEKQNWKSVKNQGKTLFAPECGGSYGVFNTRPLPDVIILYCTQDVKYMPMLWSLYNSRITSTWRGNIAQATLERIVLSQSTNFNGNGKHMALGPAGWI